MRCWTWIERLKTDLVDNAVKMVIEAAEKTEVAAVKVGCHFVFLPLVGIVPSILCCFCC